MAEKLPKKLLGKVTNNRTAKFGASFTALWRPSGQKHPSQRSFAALELAKKLLDQQNARLTLGVFPDEILPIDLKDAALEFLSNYAEGQGETARQDATSLRLLGAVFGNVEVRKINTAGYDQPHHAAGLARIR